MLTETGEDAILACDTCDYAANVEEAKAQPAAPAAATARAPPSRRSRRRASAPSRRSRFPRLRAAGPGEDAHLPGRRKAGGRAGARGSGGERHQGEARAWRAELVLAADKVVEEVTGAPVGFAGPVGCKHSDLLRPRGVRAAVLRVRRERRGPAPAQRGLQTRLLRPRDVATSATPPWATLARAARSGHFTGYRGIEVGQVFFLGTKYSAPMKCNFLDTDGKEKPMVMGCYGIGVTRIAAAAIEQNHDADGIIWPVPIAPFEVGLLSLQAGDPQVTAVAETPAR